MWFLSNITQKAPAIYRGPQKGKQSPRGCDNGIWGLAGLRRGEVGFSVNFVDFQFLKRISLVGGLKGFLVRVSIAKGLKVDSIIL